MKVVFSPLALDRIAAIEARIVEVAGRATADKVIAGFKQKARMLATMPRMGRIVVELGDPAIRELIVAPYRMVYEVRDAVGLVEVHTVLHARQQFPIDEFLDD